jgi:methionine-rich copper-binding protein CopC
MSCRFITGPKLLDTLIAALAMSFALLPAHVWSHAYPATSTPADGATVKEAREVRIQFTEGVELEFSRIDVKNSTGDLMNVGKVRRLAPDTLAVEVKPLPPGAYTVQWQVLSVDTHITEGLLRFTVGTGGK